MPQLKSIGIVLLWSLLIPAIWLLLGYVHGIWHTGADLAFLSFIAAEAIAVVVFVGFHVLRWISFIGTVQIVIHKLAAHIVLPLGITILGANIITFSHFHSPREGALYAETELVQVVMNAMMEDKNITTVTPNDVTNRSLGVNTWTAMPEGLDAAPLAGYLINTTTKYYYCWDSEGIVYAQNKKDGVRAEPKDAEKQRPCKKAPP